MVSTGRADSRRREVQADAADCKRRFTWHGFQRKRCGSPSRSWMRVWRTTHRKACGADAPANGLPDRLDATQEYFRIARSFRAIWRNIRQQMLHKAARRALRCVVHDAADRTAACPAWGACGTVSTGRCSRLQKEVHMARFSAETVRLAKQELDESLARMQQTAQQLARRGEHAERSARQMQQTAKGGSHGTVFSGNGAARQAGAG